MNPISDKVASDRVMITGLRKTANRWASDARVRKLGSLLCTVAGAWFWLAFIGMFFTSRYPFLAPFVTWTLRVSLGAVAAAIIGMMVIGPGMYVAKEFNDAFRDPRHRPLERRLTLIWCAGAGVLLSVVLATATSLLLFGVLAEIKLWFLGVCWAVLLIPWCIIGLVGCRLLGDAHRHRNPSANKSPSRA